MGKKTWQLSNLLTLVILGFGCSMMIIFYQPILKIWTGKTVQADELIIALAIWTITYAWINSNSVILNGLGIVQIQVKWLAVAAIINIILGSFLSQWFGVTGVPIATIVAILPMAILMPLSVKGVISTRGLQ